MRKVSSGAVQSVVPGSVVRIPIGSGSYGYGQLLVPPWIRVFDEFGPRHRNDVGEIVSRDVLLILAVNEEGVVEGRWQIVGHVAPGSEDVQLPDQFWQSLIDPSDVHLVNFSSSGEPSERRASAEECEGLEPRVVWFPEHVEQRLRDYVAGVENPHVLTKQLVLPSQSFTVWLTRERNADGSVVVSGCAHSRLNPGDFLSVAPGKKRDYRVSRITQYDSGSELTGLRGAHTGTLHLAPEELDVDSHRTSRLFQPVDYS